MPINKTFNNEQVIVKCYSNEDFSIRVKFNQNRPVLYSVLDVALTLDLLHEKRNGTEKMVRFDKVRQFLGETFFISDEMLLYTFLPLKEIEQLVFAYENNESEKFQRWFVCEFLPAVDLDIQSNQEYNESAVSSEIMVETSFDDKEAFEFELLGLKHTAEVLGLDKNTRFQMLVHIYKKYGVPLPIPAVGITK